MTTQTRREFLGKLGWMFAGGILVPYIPKTFYSIPGPICLLDEEIRKFKMMADGLAGPLHTLTINGRPIIGIGSWSLSIGG
ncbi:MAG TPA: hypothetical protein ENI07_00685 [Desulfobacterales bacterium]|nr:hypothetical protein [Desulfobacterales bacterium]